MTAAPASQEKLLNQTHIWYLNPDTALSTGCLEALLSVLSEPEQAQHQRFAFPRDAQRYLLSHVMLRRVLSRYVDMEPAALEFRSGPQGKPAIANAPRHAVEFNLTHTAGLAACVVTRGRACGIDAEKISARRDPLAVARRMFSAAELAQLLQREGVAQLEYFYSRWTLREAYVKARGIGISFPTRKLDFAVYSDTDIRLELAPSLQHCGGDWAFQLLRPTAQHLLAVAVERSTEHGGDIILRECCLD